MKILSRSLVMLALVVSLAACERTNDCERGAKFDKFKNGGGQWRNPDGKFCAR